LTTPAEGDVVLITNVPIYEMIGTNDAALSTLLNTVSGNVDDIESTTDALEALLASAGAGDAAAIKVAVDSLVTRLTATRAGYMDKMNVTGNLASSAEVTAIQNNTRVVRVVPQAMERPDTGSTAFAIHLYLYDTEGNMESPDSAPTISAQNHLAADRNSNLDSLTMYEDSTGHYISSYTVASDHAIEPIYFLFEVIEGGLYRGYASPTMIVDTTAVDFTVADRSKLEAIEAMLPSSTYLRGTADADGGMDTATKADVNAEADQAILDADLPTSAEIVTAMQVVKDDFKANVSAVSTHNAAAVVTELKATTIDGSLTFLTVMKWVASMSGGVIDRSGDVYQLKDQAGATLFTWTISDTGRAIS